MFFWYKDLSGFWRDLAWNLCLIFYLSLQVLFHSSFIHWIIVLSSEDCPLLRAWAASSGCSPFLLLAWESFATPFHFISQEEKLAGDVSRNWEELQKLWDFTGPTKWKLASHCYLTHCQKTWGALTQRQRHLLLIAVGDSCSYLCFLHPESPGEIWRCAQVNATHRGSVSQLKKADLRKSLILYKHH